jgi:hypothetical protein
MGDMRGFQRLRLAVTSFLVGVGATTILVCVTVVALVAAFIVSRLTADPSPAPPNQAEEQPTSRETWAAIERELTPDDAEAVVRLTLRNSYDSETSLDLVDAFLRLVPPKEVTIPSGGTISRAVVDEYGFGPRDRPNHYRAFERTILEANRLSRPEDAQPGKLLVPALPPIGMAAMDRHGVGAADRTVAFDDIGPTGGEAVVTPGAVSVERRAWRRPARTIADLRLPAKAFADFIGSRSDAVKVLFRDPNTVVLSRPMLVVPAQSTPSCQPSPLTQKPPFERVFSEAQRQELRSLLSVTPHTVTVFVLDSAWPDPDAYVESRAFLTDLVKRACRLNRTPQLARDLRKTKDSFVAGHPHAQQIRDALHEMAALSNRIRVVYVPMTKDQGASDVLETILAIGAAKDKLWGAVSGFEGPAALDDQTIAKIADEARESVSTLLSSVSPAPDPDTGQFVTNPALIDSLYQIASDVSREAGNGVFVFSQSWTAPANSIPMRLGGDPRGLIVAAVGNDGKSVDTADISYATFAKRLAFVLAVMTLDASGRPYCGTSCVDYTHEDMNAVGFNGSIPGDKCGSSFAAPRVAWLIAAREARRAGAFPDDASKWVSEVRRRIRSLRHQGQTPPESLLLDPVSYVRD